MRPEDLNELWKIENVRRSLAMLPPGSRGLSREDAILVLELLADRTSRREDSARGP